MAKTLVLGLGNTILSDDAAGILVAREIGKRAGGAVEVAEASYAGWRLTDLLSGYGRVIIVDSITEGCGPGECCRVDLGDIRSSHLSSSHGMGLGEALTLARQSGQVMPDEVAVYAIGVKNPYEFGEVLSPEVARAIPEAVRQIMEEERIQCTSGA